MKKVICYLTMAVLCLSLFFSAIPASASGGHGPLSSLKVNVYGGEEDSPDTVVWTWLGDECYLFLPNAQKTDKARCYFVSSKPVLFEGEPLESGEVTELFNRDGTLILTAGNSSYSLIVLHSEIIPDLFLSTASGSLEYIHKDKDNREPGGLRLYEDGELTLSTQLQHIKGRGNSTWYSPKKGYNIRFEEKTSVLGMPKAKKWTLLANYVDNTLARNDLALSLGRAAGLSETSQCRSVSLYINGEYLGVYLLCESVEVGSNRVDIPDLEKANKSANPEIEDLDDLPLGGKRDEFEKDTVKWVELLQSPVDISGGFLIETDVFSRYEKERSGFISAYLGNSFVIKSPEHASREEAEYIAGCWNRMEEALYSPTGYGPNGQFFAEYFDMDRLVQVFIIEEFTKEIDVGLSSLYFYKRPGNEPFCAGPIWDFDFSLGVKSDRNGTLHYNDPDTWYAMLIWKSRTKQPSIYARCWSFPEFREMVYQEWSAQFTYLTGEWMLARTRKLCTELETVAVMNHIRWQTYNTTDIVTVREQYNTDVKELVDFLEIRKKALDLGFSSRGALITYENSDGIVAGYDSTIYALGDSAQAINGDKLNLDGYDFLGWNTAPDGSGLAIAPGEEFTVTENYMILYTQWVKKR